MSAASSGDSDCNCKNSKGNGGRTTLTIIEAPHGMDAEESEGRAGRAGNELVNDELEKYDE